MKRILLLLIFAFLSVALFAAPEFGVHYYAVKHKDNNYVSWHESRAYPNFCPLAIHIMAGDIIYGAGYYNDENNVYYFYVPNSSSSSNSNGSVLCNKVEGNQENLDFGVEITETGTYILELNESTKTLSWTVPQKVEINGFYYNLIEYANTAEVTFKDHYADGYATYSGSVDVPESITYNSNTYSVTCIGPGAFHGCTNLNSVSIPNSLASIGDYAFYSCNLLTSITLPNSVESIGSNAFKYCSGLTLMTIPNSVASISTSLFEGCTCLTSITLPNSAMSIGESAFLHCERLTDITIPNNVKSIGSGAFMHCYKLKSVKFPKSVTSIGTSLFDHCHSLNSVSVPNSVTVIMDGMFDNCYALTLVTIPNSVGSIGTEVFSNCSNLSYVICFAKEIPSLSSDVFKDSNVGSATLFVPASVLEDYKASAQWKDFGTINSIEEIDPGPAYTTDVFRYKHSVVLAKNVGNITSSDLDAINKALSEYNQLVSGVKSELTTEKNLLNSLKTKAEEMKAVEADVEATVEANTFKTNNATILGKSTSTVTSSDLAAINKALEDYDSLSEAAKNKLTNGEKALLDVLKTKAEELKTVEDAEAAAIAEANKFKSDNVTILGKTTSTVTFSDLIVIYKALVDYDKLPEKAKDMLIDEKELLDELREKSERIRNYDINGDNKITITDVTTLIDVIVNQ